jgi:hypothetical protein
MMAMMRKGQFTAISANYIQAQCGFIATVFGLAA